MYTQHQSKAVVNTPRPCAQQLFEKVKCLLHKSVLVVYEHTPHPVRRGREGERGGGGRGGSKRGKREVENVKRKKKKKTNPL